jgi:hypothetical protein
VWGKGYPDTKQDMGSAVCWVLVFSTVHACMERLDASSEHVIRQASCRDRVVVC